MDIIVGALIWGGLLVALLWWRGGRATPPPADTAPSTWTARSATAVAPPRPVERETERETEALVDGLVIGHVLTRDHYQRRIEELDDELTSARTDAGRHHLEGEDDLVDPTDPLDLEFDGFDGFDGFDEFDDD